VEEVARAEAAKESERLRGLMLDSITHELRTPLTSIKASVSTLLTSNLPTDLAHELLTVIDEESDRLNKLVSQAVEMAQLDTQEVHMSFSSQPLGAMIDAALQSEAVMLAGHRVTVKIPGTLPNVNADPVWIQKLISNLLENAAKYSEPGTPITVIAEVRGDSVACSVADRGAGIEPMEQSLIFDKFYRSRKRSANTSGTGMGLAICRAIAEAHNGTISVTSQLGQGSVFTFTLPIR
jgi:two-component system, OmpR family, sensor histidine kinase KdpD